MNQTWVWTQSKSSRNLTLTMLTLGPYGRLDQISNKLYMKIESRYLVAIVKCLYNTNTCLMKTAIRSLGKRHKWNKGQHF